MKIKLVTDEIIAGTSSRGNQEKWLDKGIWYKLDMFGYEALSETLISRLLSKSNISADTPFGFVSYEMDKVNVHNRERVCCKSRDFLDKGQEIITLNRLISCEAGRPLKAVLSGFSSDKKRLQYIVSATTEITGLSDFDKYISVLFDLDAAFLNTDRHLNNIAVLHKNGKYDYCPIFDNGAGLLSDMITARTDIESKALAESCVSMPFGMSFTRQSALVRRLYGRVLCMPKFTEEDIKALLSQLLLYYPERDRGVISDRVAATIMLMQKKLN